MTAPAMAITANKATMMIAPRIVGDIRPEEAIVPSAFASLHGLSS